MTTEVGKGDVYTNGELYAKVVYDFVIREARGGWEEISGFIVVGSDGPDFMDEKQIYRLECENSRSIKFHVSDPHPAALSLRYDISVVDPNYKIDQSPISKSP